MSRSHALLLLGLLAAGPTRAAGVEQAARLTATDLTRAHETLARQREQIARERAELSEQLDAGQTEVLALRAQMQVAREDAGRRDTARLALERRAASQEAEFRALSALLAEFRRAAEARMDPAQHQRRRPQLERIDAALAADEAAGFQLSALEAVLALLNGIMLEDPPSRPFRGVALDVQGRLHEGHFIRAGPFAGFADDAGQLAGYVVLDPSGTEPLVMLLPDAHAERAVRDWLAGTATTASLDVSGGALQQLRDARRSLPERVRQGGVVMIPLLLIGLAALLIGVARALALHRLNVNVNPVLTRLLERIDAGDAQAARRTADAVPRLWREVLTDAVDHWQADRAYLEEILQDRIAMQAPRVNQYLAALSICAAAAPLLGLLGTVTGMIHTFQLITVFGTGDARTLSGGISEALITTQFGLLVAVPALLAHAYLTRKAKAILSGMEQAAIRLIRHIPATAAAAQSQETSCLKD